MVPSAGFTGTASDTDFARRSEASQTDACVQPLEARLAYYEVKLAGLEALVQADISTSTDAEGGPSGDVRVRYLVQESSGAYFEMFVAEEEYLETKVDFVGMKDDASNNDGYGRDAGSDPGTTTGIDSDGEKHPIESHSDSGTNLSTDYGTDSGNHAGTDASAGSSAGTFIDIGSGTFSVVERYGAVDQQSAGAMEQNVPESKAGRGFQRPLDYELDRHRNVCERFYHAGRPPSIAPRRRRITWSSKCLLATSCEPPLGLLFLPSIGR